MTQKMCEVDARRLMAYLEDPAADPDLLIHIADCAYCQTRLDTMGLAALNKGQGRKKCNEYFEDLKLFVGAEAKGEPLNRFTALMLHLAVCPDCFARYEELCAMNELLMTVDLPAVPRSAYRPPDLSFLHTEWVPIRIAGKLLETLRVSLAILFQPTSLVPVPTRAKSTVKVDTGDIAEVKKISLGAEQLGRLDVDLRLCTNQKDPALARLEVYALAVERVDLDFSGTRVVLRFADGREMSRLTDESGLALFEGVLEAELRKAMLEITLADDENGEGKRQEDKMTK